MKQNLSDFEQRDNSEKESHQNLPSRTPQRRPMNPTGGPGNAPAQPSTGSPATGPRESGAMRPAQGPSASRPTQGFQGPRPGGSADLGNRSGGGSGYRPAAPNTGRTQSGPFPPRPSGPVGPSRPASGGGPGGARRPSGPPNGRPQGGRPQNGQRGGRPGDRRPASSGGVGGPARSAAVAVKPRPTEPVAIPPQVGVRDLATLLEVAPMEIIRELFKHNILANINQVITYESAAMVAKELGFNTTEAAPPQQESAQKAEVQEKGAASHLVHRPPVVTVMGHVDHGKTSLLDTIRKTHVAAGEAGGITQHIGAYQVEINGKKITFLDTPGHEAFTAMRARGAKVTDIAVIVVAADDGVMPQTVEAIDHARAAKVPIIVALNKIDKAGANSDHVKNQLVEAGVVIEEYGGDVVCVPVSARKNMGIDDLLEMILLVADVQDLKANPHSPAQGTIIESRMDKSRGASATVLMEQGTLKTGDVVVVGSISGKVRNMFDDKGKQLKKAGPSMPVEILGLPEVPRAGDRLEEVADEKTAKNIAQQRAQQQKAESAGGTRAFSLDSLSSEIQAGKAKELNLLIKADVQGSLEAIKPTLERLGEDTVKVRILHDGVGNISETDVHLASASKAVIIGFNVKIDSAAQRLAQNEGVDIRSYDVIYKLSDDIEAALKGMLEPTYREQVDGHAEVLQLFKAGKTMVIGGCRVTDGKLVRSAQVRLLRGGKVIFTGSIASLRRGKDDAREVATGFECGISLEDFNQLEVGDVIEAFSKVRV